jgi:hypothetical protein
MAFAKANGAAAYDECYLESPQSVDKLLEVIIRLGFIFNVNKEVQLETPEVDREAEVEVGKVVGKEKIVSRFFHKVSDERLCVTCPVRRATLEKLSIHSR